MTKAISSYEIKGNEIHISTPYCAAVIKQCRAWAGKFRDSCWVVPVSRLAIIESLIGRDQDDLVEIETTTWNGTAAEIYLGWRVLAGRRGRDSAANVYADLVDGTIPSWGGSAKHPCVDPSSDAKFRLWVPRDFAARYEVTVVTDLKTETVVEVVDYADKLATVPTDALLAELNRRGVTA